MLRFVGTRLINIVIVVFLVSLATFFMLDLAPGSAAAAIAGQDASDEQIAALEEELGLNDPLLQRYARWMGDAVQGDLGRTLTKFPISEEIRNRVPVTAQLAVMALGISVLTAVPAAVLASYRQGRTADQVLSGTAFTLLSVPNFVIAVLVVFFFAIGSGSLTPVVILLLCIAVLTTATSSMRREAKLAALVALLAGLAALVAVWPDWHVDFFPTGFWMRLTDNFWLNLKHAFLPAITLAALEFSQFMRLLRADMIATLQEDFILSARAKGIPTFRVLFGHALRPSSFSLITLAGVALARLIGGTVVVEVYFSLGGLGKFMVDSVSRRDLVAVQGAVLFVAIVYVVLNLLVDISYRYLDPRIRRS